MAEGLARPVRDQVEVEVPDDDSLNHLPEGTLGRCVLFAFKSPV